MINAMNAEEKKLFLKEVALLSGLNHPNVVRFMFVCHQPPAMMLEYIYFDFNLFGAVVRESTLSDFVIKSMSMAVLDFKNWFLLQPQR